MITRSDNRQQTTVGYVQQFTSWAMGNKHASKSEVTLTSRASAIVRRHTCSTSSGVTSKKIFSFQRKSFPIYQSSYVTCRVMILGRRETSCMSLSYRTSYKYEHLLATCIRRTQGCIFRLTCSHRELTKDPLLTSVYVKISRTVTRNSINKSV